MVEAMLPTAQIARWLKLAQPEACLQIKRRTWSAGGVASYARLAHPGSRYRLGSYYPVGRAPAQSRSSG